MLRSVWSPPIMRKPKKLSNRIATNIPINFHALSFLLRSSSIPKAVPVKRLKMPAREAERSTAMLMTTAAAR